MNKQNLVSIASIRAERLRLLDLSQELETQLHTQVADLSEAFSPLWRVFSLFAGSKKSACDPSQSENDRASWANLTQNSLFQLGSDILLPFLATLYAYKLGKKTFKSAIVGAGFQFVSEQISRIDFTALTHKIKQAWHSKFAAST